MDGEAEDLSVQKALTDLEIQTTESTSNQEVFSAVSQSDS